MTDILRYGTAENVDEVFRDGYFSYNIAAESGMSVLMIAVCEKADAKVIKYLVDHGADPNAKYSSGVTVLMLAAYLSDDPEVIDVLLSAGADANAQYNNKITALMIAEEVNSNPEVIRRLKAAQSSPSEYTRTNNFFSAVMRVFEAALKVWVL